MSRPCSAAGCGQRVGDRFLFCRRHWRIVTSDVREVWRHIVADFHADGDADAFLHNLGEVIRLVAEAEARGGVDGIDGQSRCGEAPGVDAGS